MCCALGYNLRQSAGNKCKQLITSHHPSSSLLKVCLIIVLRGLTVDPWGTLERTVAKPKKSL